MTNNENESKFLELARKKIFTVLENGDIYKTKCRLCNSECLIKANIRLDKGCPYYRMRFNYERKRYTVLVHRVVYIFFHGEIPYGMQINHKDGNKKNNALSNLELVTPKENILHAIYVLKTFKGFGVNHFKPRLNPAEIAKILYYRKLCGFTQERLAERFGVSRTKIRRICKFSIWRDLLKREDSTVS